MTRKSVPICGLAGTDEIDILVGMVQELGAWDAVAIRWPDAAALEATRETAAGYIMLGGGEATRSLAAALAGRDEQTPLVVVGPDPAPLSRPSCWLASLLPASSVLAALLGQPRAISTAPPPPSSVSRRRKTESIVGNSLASYRVAKASFEEDYYAQLLRITEGNVTFAARLSKKTRKEIYDALKRLGLDAASYRHPGAPTEDLD